MIGDPSPANKLPPSPPQISYVGGELTVVAKNSTLSDVLKGIQTAIGAKIEGVTPTDTDRVFGQFGPASPQAVCSTLLTGSVMAVAAGLLPLGILSQLVSIGSLLAFLLVCIGVVLLRKTAPAVERPFRVPWVPWVPILGGLSCLAQMVSLPWSTWERLLVWLVLGWAIYFLYSRRHARDLRLARDAPTEVALT